ncbi:hypothetical protein [Streptomyces sp. NPDC005046]
MQHGGPQRSWEYAVRNALEHRPAAALARSEADQRTVIALAALRERGDVRGLAASLAREHGGSPDIWSRAVNTVRGLTDPTTLSAQPSLSSAAARKRRCSASPLRAVKRCIQMMTAHGASDH